MNQQLEESEQQIADFGKQNTELEEELRVMRSQLQEKDGGAKAGVVDRTNLKLRSGADPGPPLGGVLN